MKMINDMDLYFADAYNKETVPAWMKAERFDYCETSTRHTRNAIARFFGSKKAN